MADDPRIIMSRKLYSITGIPIAEQSRTKISFLALVLLLLLLSTGCSQKEEPPENLSTDLPTIKAPSGPADKQSEKDVKEIPIRISPVHPRKEDILILKGLKGPITYKWYVNGREIPDRDEPLLDYNGLKKGDEVRAEAISSDLTYTSNTVTILNTAPSVQNAWILPKYPVIDSTLTANAEGYDLDGDEVRFSFEWYLNDKMIQEDESSSFSDQFVKGDIVTLKIIPDDGEDQGKPLSREVTIKNSPPLAETSLFNTVIKDGIYYAEVKAFDPDKDSLIYELQDEPKGMTINKNTGRISWKIPEKKGRYEITISVTDMEGAKALLTIPVISRTGEESSE